jgi:Metallopeptidase toxin 3
MKMTAAAIKAYPKLHRYLRVDMPKVANVKAIMSQIKKLSGKTPTATIKEALKYGTDPSITIVPGLVCAGVQAYGCCALGSNEIRIDEQLVKDFEAGKGLVKNAKGQQVYLVGATLLHELTHWADGMDGVDDPIPGDPTNEEGNAFEMGVYGKILG